ncbi:Protein TOXD [Pseudocercospora fuligena]|uniref:Protein TOXD n=1 Tax=Pseudocercospora fuligena TaxID=685502 RepID=A0A8H6VAX5_9PEZI|nr:Protein TOXD [Pseudocercospora fuligena]
MAATYPQNYGLVREKTSTAVLKAIPIPRVPDDYILIRTVAVALNPTDWTTIDAEGANETLVGVDYAGTVEAVGKAVTRPFRKGDRVAGLAHGANDSNPENGAFARYISVKGDLAMHIPDGVSFEAAAGVGSGVGTTLLALYRHLGLELPKERNNKSQGAIFIYGGSTATGTIAIQFAKLSGYRVLTTCSPKHFDLMKDRGADMVYDYRSFRVGEQIRADTNNELSLVLDTVAVESSAAICAKAIGASGGIYCNLLGIDGPRDDVKSIFFLAYELSGESYIFENEHYEGMPESLEFGRKYYAIAEHLWAEGSWEPHPVNVRTGGLLGAIDGMQAMRNGMEPSGEKLVYRIDETIWPDL